MIFPCDPEERWWEWRYLFMMLERFCTACWLDLFFTVVFLIPQIFTLSLSLPSPIFPSSVDRPNQFLHLPSLPSLPPSLPSLPASQYGSEASSKPVTTANAPRAFQLKGPFDDYFSYIDRKEETYVYRLRDAVAIKSVSAWPDHRPEVIRMIEWTKKWIEKLGGNARLHENPGHDRAGPMQKLDDGTEIPLPPILLGQFGNDPKKKTVCVYGHLDVQPAELSDGWDTPPFELTDVDGKLFGRGSTDDKGPALSWLWMVEVRGKRAS